MNGFESRFRLLRSGDLIFLECDRTPFSEAIVAASASSQRLDHVGILDFQGDRYLVVEANSRLGVVATPLDEFLERAPGGSAGTGWHASRVVDGDVDIEAALCRARSWIGLEYNWRFLPSSGALYCSELVRNAFLRSSGACFFSEIPMDFHCGEAAGRFWTEHFRSLGISVPQGAPGTSPQSLRDEASSIF